MNFLSHLALSERSPETFQFGSMLPDFAAMGQGRVIPMKDPAERAALPDQLQEVRRGIDFHYYIDAKYDELPEYIKLKRKFSDIVDRTNIENRLVRRALPVLGIDLLLDGVRQNQKPDVIEQFQRSLSVAGRFNLADLVTSPAGTQRVFDEFCPNIPDYGRVGDVADAIGGILLRRFGRHNPTTRTIEYPYSVKEKGLIFDALKRFQPWILENGPELLQRTEELADGYFQDNAS